MVFQFGGAVAGGRCQRNAAVGGPFQELWPRNTIPYRQFLLHGWRTQFEMRDLKELAIESDIVRTGPCALDEIDDLFMRPVYGFHPASQGPRHADATGGTATVATLSSHQATQARETVPIKSLAFGNQGLGHLGFVTLFRSSSTLGMTLFFERLSNR
jgi:hypothetical protein